MATGTTESMVKDLEARVALLEEKNADLAAMLGRVISAMFGAEFEDPDDGGEPMLEWVTDVDEEDGFTCGWWKYRPEGVVPAGEASGA